jgi:hypothetical protein
VDLEILKKKLSSFKSDGGKVTKVNDELLLEILSAWELWTGTARDFYKGIGSNHKKMARMIGKAKQLKREGHSVSFDEIRVEGITSHRRPTSYKAGAEKINSRV